MSQLFSKSIIKSAISWLQWLSLDREIALVNELYNDFRKGNMKDETRYEQNFNELFFHQLLGYDPKTNLHPKASTPVWSKIADVGLGFFVDGQYSYEWVKVVVELKWSEALLDKKQASYGWQTPVDQWFGYKTSFKDCPWLIVSNFASIRLYRDNKQDFELWTIEDLVKPDNDYYNLKSLLVILGRKYLISESGKSPTETRLSEVRIIQEQITKKFYQQYKTLRFELINDIRRHNTEVSIEAVVEKSQKIIDRVIFIHFCEDKWLLPDNKLRANIGQAREAWFTPWEILKRFFHFIDVGSKDGTIPAYNGWLFAPDADLDTLEVGDEICYKFINLGDYSFDDELSVNILGHIFEQSISDIEQLKIDLLWQEMETDQLVDASSNSAWRKESKRKKDGIFYTPEYIVDYIVQNSLMTYLEEKEQECFHKYPKDELKAYQAYQQILQNVKVLDPACGSGAFLVRVFDYLYSENKRIWQIVWSLFDDSSIYKDILRNNIYGVDLNPESVEITKLSLWLKSAQKGKKLNNLDDNIKCGNSLIDDPAVAGERAFDWNQAFPTILGSSVIVPSVGDKFGNEANWFDVIVGNPPYVTTKYENMWPEIKEYLLNKYEVAYDKLDLYVLFIEKSILLLKEGWKTSMITPWNFMKNFYSFKLRKFILDNTQIDFFTKPTETVFLDVVVETIVWWFTKRLANNYLINFNEISVVWSNRIWDISNQVYLKNKDNVFDLSWSDIANLILASCRKKSKLMWEVALNYIWIMAGWQKDMVSDEPIFDNSKKVLAWKEIWRYSLWYEWNYINFDRSKIHSNDRESVYLTEEKVLLRKTGNSFVASYDNQQYYTLQSLYNIIIYDTNQFAPKYILILLNSKLFTYLYQIFFITNPQQFPYIKRKHLDEFPIKEISLSTQQPFIDKADLMLSLNQQLHDRSDTVLRFLTHRYAIIKPSTKLQKRRELDFSWLLKELKSIKISLADQADLMDYFESKKKEVLELKQQIDTTDRQIDEMVFELYGLTEEERRVVLDS